jgi:ribosomal protein S27E
MTDSAVKKAPSNGTGKLAPVRCEFCRRYLFHTAKNKDCLAFVFCPKCKNYTVILGEKQASLTDLELCAMITW